MFIYQRVLKHDPVVSKCMKISQIYKTHLARAKHKQFGPHRPHTEKALGPCHVQLARQLFLGQNAGCTLIRKFDFESRTNKIDSCHCEKAPEAGDKPLSEHQRRTKPETEIDI